MVNYPSDYYNRFDVTKGYKRLAFVAGRGIQSSELNELQDTILNELKSIANYLVSNGSILSGGEVDNIAIDSITIKSATIYADGTTYNVAQRVVPISGSGVELIGMAVLKTLITDNEDIGIRNQVVESPNYGQPGAYRVKESGTWKKSTEVTGDEVFFPIITLSNGQIATTSSTTNDNNVLRNLIGQYDYDVRGSYVLSGINVTYKSTDATTKEIIMLISSGRARVLGSAVSIPFQKEVRLPAVDDIRAVSSEPYVFAAVGDYALRNTPVNSIAAIQGTKQVTRTITHGGFSGAVDTLPDTPVLSLVAINQGGSWNGTAFTGGTTYTTGVDYILSGDDISWAPAGAEPAPGSTYTAVYRYVATFAAAVSSNGLGVTIAAGDTLVVGSTFYVDYSYYLSRVDRISLDTNGNFIVSRGTPAQYGFVAPSKISAALSIASITLVKGGTPVVVSDTIVNVTLNELSDIKLALQATQYNIARLSLLENSRSVDPTTNKRNLIVDPLYDNDQRDSGVSQNAVIKNKELIIKSNLTQLAGLTSDIFLPIINSSIALQQPYSTKSVKINPYALSTSPLTCRITLSPKILSNTRWWYQAGGYNTTTAQQTFLVSLSLFNANETVKVSFLGSDTNVVMNSSGQGSVTLTVPLGTAAGSYLVRALGITSGGVAEDTSSVVVSFIPQPPPPRRDPVAQTFVVTQKTDINAVQLKITELPTDNVIDIKVVGVTLGIPDKDNLLGKGSILRSATVIGWNTINLDRPVSLNPDQEYAIVVLTGKPIGSVGTAKIGQYDSQLSYWVNSQQVDGVLLVSANESTWTPIQDEDLSFKLMKPVYQLTNTVTLMTLNGLTNVTDWLLSGQIITPPDTTLRLYLETGAGVTYEMSVDSPLFTVAISGTAYIKAALETKDNTRTPILDNNLVLLAGTGDYPATYFTRAFSIPSGSTTPATAKLIIEEYKPANTTVAPAIEFAPGTYNAMTFSTGTQVGDGWVESTYTLAAINVNTSRLKITLSTSDSKVRPKVRNIRLLIS